MRKITILVSAMALITFGLRAQTVSTFESLVLPHPDTFYVNYTASGTDVGVTNGLAHFPCVYDTSFGGYWSTGFSYSNMTDSITSGFTNQYAAKAGIGFGGSANYLVAYGSTNYVKHTGTAIGKPASGFYITNSTYTCNSMRDGDAFARKFHNGDWFMVTVHGYNAGVLRPDSVNFYLADYRFPDSTMNYIVKNWRWVNLLTIGNVDSLQFTLNSSDTGMYGMNTPAYFCIDNYTTAESITLGTSTPQRHAGGRVYPVPASDILHIDLFDKAFTTAIITDLAGRSLGAYSLSINKTDLTIESLIPGTYVLQLLGDGVRSDVRFIKN